MVPVRDKKRMIPSPQVQAVTLTVCDDKERRVFREFRVAIQQINSRLEDSPAAPTDLYCFSQFIRLYYSLVIWRGVAKDKPDMVHVPRLAVTGDDPQSSRKKMPIHRPGSIQQYAKNVLRNGLVGLSPGRTRNIRSGALAAAHP